MPVSFERTLRSLDGDSPTSSHTTLAMLAVLCVGWGWWLFSAQIPVYLVSKSARVEVATSKFPIEASISGRAEQIWMRLGKAVAVGDPLIRLRSFQRELDLDQTTSQVSRLDDQIREMQSTIGHRGRVLGEIDKTFRLRLEQAESRLASHSASEQYAFSSKARTKSLVEQGLSPRTDMELADLVALKATAARTELTLEIQELRSERRSETEIAGGLLAQLRSQLAELEATRDAMRIDSTRAQLSLDETQIVSPIAGVVEGISEVRPGTFVEQGDLLGVVIGEERLRLVCDLPPGSSIGRVQEGHPARVLLDGFPWTQYGSVRALVTRVGSETVDGQVSVELELLEQHVRNVQLKHGMSGTVEIEIDRRTPVALLIRAVGGEVL